MRLSLVALLLLPPLLEAGETGTRVQYVGGTVTGMTNKCSAHIEVAQDDFFTFTVEGKSIQVSYKDVSTLEYGTRVSRRYIEAALISPMFLIGKRKTHFLTIGYLDSEGRQQAMVLEVGKENIRPLLVSLEARTGRKVEFQDEEARKAGKG